MTYIRSVPRMADTDEAVATHIENVRAWLEDAKEQAYRNPASIAFAIEELAKAVNTLAGATLTGQEP